LNAVRFLPRFWFSPPVRRAGLEAVGLFVTLAHYAAEQGMIDGRLDVFPVSLRERAPKRALKALVSAGMARMDGKVVVLLGRGETWWFSNPTPLVGAERKRLVAEVSARDGAHCAYCGRTGDLTLDHVIPRSQGGPNDARNLVMACNSCNSSKGDRTPAEWLGAEGMP
jgi:hypothetical protein